MTTIRKFRLHDLLHFSSVNLDHLTWKARMFNYQTFLSRWHNFCHVAVAPGNRIVGYLLGVTEDRVQTDKGEVITVSVDSQYRRHGVGTKLMRTFENQLKERVRSLTEHHFYYVYLFVGALNNPAKRFFKEMGYKIINTIPEFYPKNNNEDAHKMRKVVG